MSAVVVCALPCGCHYELTEFTSSDALYSSLYVLIRESIVVDIDASHTGQKPFKYVRAGCVAVELTSIAIVCSIRSFFSIGTC